MAIGPCLCGDPYCSSCGNPSAAKFADAIEDFCERLENDVHDEYELSIFYEAGLKAVHDYRKTGRKC